MEEIKTPYINIQTDFGFKEVFGQVKNKKALEGNPVKMGGLQNRIGGNVVSNKKHGEYGRYISSI